MSSKNPFFVELAMEIALPHTLLQEISRRFSPEKARECAMSTSVGGIGPLLRERIFGQSEAGMELMGVTVLYEAVWAQAWHEWGQLNLQKRNVGPELRQMLTRSGIDFEITYFDGKKAPVEVWELAYGKAKVYFLSAGDVTDVVYPGPKDMPHPAVNPYAWSHELRLRQSWLVGRGALHICEKLNLHPDVITLSETPTLFAHHRLVTDAFQKSDRFAHTKYVFNDHTPLEYAHPIWDVGTIESVKIDPALYTASTAWNSAKKTLDVTSLLVDICDGVFGVARKHGDVMRMMSSLKEFGPKIEYITNGVRTADWQAPELADYNSLTDEQIADIKERKKKTLLDWAWRHCRLWPTWAQQSMNRKVVLWTRRITPYKRMDILLKMLRVPEWRERFVRTDVVLLIGGRVHQQDNHAQDIVYDLLDLLDKDKILSERVVFVDNFNVWEAPMLFQGADGAVMMADDTREASATGFMKAQMNGGAIIATNDGAIPEFVRFSERGDADAANGFGVPYVNGEPTPEGLLLALEAFDAAFRNDAVRTVLIRNALRETPQLDVARTVREMKALYERVLQKASVPAG